MTDARASTVALGSLVATTPDARLSTAALAALTAPVTTDARATTLALSVLARTKEPPDPRSYEAAVLALGPWGYWKLDESSGTQAADDSGNFRHGTYTNGPTLHQAPIVLSTDNSVHLAHASSQYVDVHTDMSALTSWTICAWMIFDTIVGEVNFIGSSYESSVELFKWGFDASGKWMLQSYWGGFHNGSSASGPVAGTPYFAACTFNPATGVMKMRVNGADVLTVTGVPPTSAPNTFFYIGNGGDIVTHWVDGRMSDVAIWSSALADATTDALYIKGLARLAHSGWGVPA